MSAKKSTTDTRIKEIIKYDTTRKYFGDWSPYQLNRCYPCLEPVSLQIGVLSVDKICDTLWNEMSYNPKRFGTQSPFKFHGKNSLYMFIAKDLDQKDHAFYTLSKIQAYLSKFWLSAMTYDKTFLTNQRFKNKYVIIKNIPQQNPDSKPVPGATYQMLGYLRNCIHIIASQNLKDFDRKTYREQMIPVINARHPDFVRPKDYYHSKPDFLKYLRDKTELENAISEQTSEISVTQSRIDSLNNDFENPGDTSAENARLRAQMDALNALESKLRALQQKHRIYGN